MVRVHSISQAAGSSLRCRDRVKLFRESTAACTHSMLQDPFHDMVTDTVIDGGILYTCSSARGEHGLSTLQGLSRRQGGLQSHLCFRGFACSSKVHAYSLLRLLSEGQLCSASEEARYGHYVRLWDTVAKKCSRMIPGFEPLSCISATENPSIVLIGASDRKVRRLDFILREPQVSVYSGYRSAISDVQEADGIVYTAVKNLKENETALVAAKLKVQRKATIEAKTMREYVQMRIARRELRLEQGTSSGGMQAALQRAQPSHDRHATARCFFMCRCIDGNDNARAEPGRHQYEYECGTLKTLSRKEDPDAGALRTDSVHFWGKSRCAHWGDRSSARHASGALARDGHARFGYFCECRY